MSTIATAVLTGAGVGLSIAAPIGPTSMLCVQRTLSAGLLTGIATGFGVATVHLTYGTLAVRWGSAFATAWTDTALLSLASGLLLLAFAFRCLRRIPKLSEQAEPHRTLAATYCGAVGIGFLNPITPILFAAATPALVGLAAAPIPLIIVGVFLGSFGWWIALSAAVSMLRGRLSNYSLGLMNKAAALVLATFALGMVAKGALSSLNVLPVGWMAGWIGEAAGVSHMSAVTHLMVR